MEITIERLTNPPTAKAAFLGYVSYRDRQEQMPYNNYASRLIVDLCKQHNGWLLTGHIEEQDLNGRYRVINAQ